MEAFLQPEFQQTGVYGGGATAGGNAYSTTGEQVL